MTAPDADPRRLRVVARARTAVGRQRSDNQDAFSLLGLGGDAAGDGTPGGDVVPDLSGVGDPAHAGDAEGAGGLDAWSLVPSSARLDGGEGGALLLVADGMGGAAAGEVASRLAVTTVEEVVAARWPRDGRHASGAAEAEALSELMREAVATANDRIHEWSDRHAEYRGMGSTLTAVGVVGRRAVVAQVGDSRAYLVRDGRPVQLTEDQTVAQKLVESGSMDPEEARKSGQAHVLLQALGTEPEVRPEVETHDLRPGDRLLLCTDGLSQTVPGPELAEVLAGDAGLDAAAERLIERANAGGGPDNITVLLARLTAAAGPAPGTGTPASPTPGPETPAGPAPGS